MYHVFFFKVAVFCNFNIHKKWLSNLFIIMENFLCMCCVYGSRKGDYYRYLAEFVQSNSEYCDKSLTAYKTASDIAIGEDGLATTHPIRLGLFLNFSVFFYEILGEKNKAAELAKNAFDDAIVQIDTLSEDYYKDTSLIMQLLRDNLRVWTENQEEFEGKKQNAPVFVNLRRNFAVQYAIML